MQSIPSAGRKGRRALRFAMFLLLAFLVGLGLKHVAVRLHESREPAGFSRGMLQGALMPCTLPALLMGYDTPIYAEKNRGVSYKLGYTMGVNVCGAVFFGFVYWRLNRWRRRRSASQEN